MSFWKSKVVGSPEEELSCGPARTGTVSGLCEDDSSGAEGLCAGCG